MNYTKKLQLGKPDENEYYDINVINHNMDILDGAIEDRIEQADLIKTIVSEHMDDTDNPHQITKEQIGMEKVPNVATNDQAVTYTPVVEPKALSSGERLSVAFGKLAGAVADYIVHKANILQRMTVVETGINDLNKNFNYFEIFNWNGLAIYKNNNNDIRFYCNTSWINGITENTMILYKADAQINGITNTSHLLLPVRITTTSYNLLGIGFFLVKPDAVTFIPLCTYSGQVLMYGCSYGI